MRDHNLSWSVCRAEQERGVAAIEAIGAYHTHLGPISEEGVVLKDRQAERLRYLQSPIQHNFPGGREMMHYC